MTKSDTNEAAGRHSLREWQDNAHCFWMVWRREEARLAALEDPVAFVTEANNLLHEYCPGVVVELEGPPADGALVFSANGDLEHFPQVLALIATAAESTERSVLCFRQRLGSPEQFAIRMGGVEMQAADILVRCEEWRGLPALDVAFAKPPKAEDLETSQRLALIMLDHVLGEWDAVVKVGALDFVEAVPPEAVPLHRLPEKLDEVWKALGRDAFYPEPEWQYTAYQRDEDEENEQDYLAMYRFLDYGTVAWNVCQISMLSCLLIDLGGLGPSAASLLLIVLGIWAGAYCLKITSKIRNYKLSIMATPKEVLDYLDTYDEGEKQAEMEEAYLILFKVNQLLIPGIYVVLVVLSVVLGQVQLVALLVAVVIHLYTNVAQLRKTKRYFK